MIKLTEEQLNKLFELASIKLNKSFDSVISSDITLALVEIERKIYSFSSEVKIDSIGNKKVLIADDLELSIYQLTTVLKKIGITPSVARHKDEAIAELHKAQFDCIIIDLFIPDCTDGFELIKAAVKRKKELNSDFKIVVISGTDDSVLIDRCYDLGIDFCIRKDKDWHSKLLKFLNLTFQTDHNVAYTRYIINNDIASYEIKSFNEEKTFKDIIKSINTSLYTGIKHIIFDLKDISKFDLDNAYIFADVFKLCSENKGDFILVKPSNNIKEALAFAYLEDLIPVASSVDEAVADIKKS